MVGAVIVDVGVDTERDEFSHFCRIPNRTTQYDDTGFRLVHLYGASSLGFGSSEL